MERQLCVRRLILLCFVTLPALAYGDRVEDLVRSLTSDPSYKVRVQSALVLGKLGDKRAVPGLIRALKDSHAAVRAVACGALGKLGDPAAIEPLKELSKDPEAMVRQAAEKALQQLQTTPPPSTTKAKFYVNVGNLANKTKQGGTAAVKIVRDALLREFSRSENVVTSWEGGTPDAAALKKKKMVGYYLDGSIIRLSTTVQGNSAEISCDLKMFIATYPGKSMIMFTSGGAAVQTGVGPRAEEAAQKDCLEAAAQAVHQNVMTFLKAQE